MALAPLARSHVGKPCSTAFFSKAHLRVGSLGEKSQHPFREKEKNQSLLRACRQWSPNASTHGGQVLIPTDPEHGAIRLVIIFAMMPVTGRCQHVCASARRRRPRPCWVAYVTDKRERVVPWNMIITSGSRENTTELCEYGRKDGHRRPPSRRSSLRLTSSSPVPRMSDSP